MYWTEHSKFWALSDARLVEDVLLEKWVPLSITIAMWVPGEEIIHISAGLNLEFLMLLYLVLDWFLLKNIYSWLLISIKEIGFPEFGLSHVTFFANETLADLKCSYTNDLTLLCLCHHYEKGLGPVWVNVYVSDVNPVCNKEQDLDRPTAMNQNHTANHSLD